MEKLRQFLRRIPKSFELFWGTLKNAQRDFWNSVFVLFWVSLVLSFLFFFVEHAAQPDEYRNWWQAFVWTITRYIGDPGRFAGNGPITLTGRCIDMVIAILQILIFAILTGYVADSYRDAKRQNYLQECREKIRKSFKRVRNTDTKYRVVPRNISVVSLSVKNNLTENDIIETVAKYKEFRLRNLGDAQPRSEHPQDRLAVELMPFDEKTVDGFSIEKTSYGIKINRHSNVTIVAPTADRENSIGPFAYYLAQFGGFNLVSRLLVDDSHDRISYLTIEDKHNEPALDDYINDIKGLSTSDKNWNIIVSATKKAPTAQVHFAHNNSEGKAITTINEATLQQLYDNLSSKLKSQHNIDSDMDNSSFLPIGDNSIAVVAGAGNINNAFIMRLSYRFITWTDRWTDIIVDMAETIRNCIESTERQQLLKIGTETRKETEKLWKKNGIGFGEGDIEMKTHTDSK